MLKPNELWSHHFIFWRMFCFCLLFKNCKDVARTENFWGRWGQMTSQRELKLCKMTRRRCGKAKDRGGFQERFILSKLKHSALKLLHSGLCHSKEKDVCQTLFFFLWLKTSTHRPTSFIRNSCCPLNKGSKLFNALICCCSFFHECVCICRPALQVEQIQWILLTIVGNANCQFYLWAIRCI